MATILIVDDRPPNRDYLSNVLKCDDHRVLEAGTGEAALPAAASHQPDLIITDVLMPAMDGYELVRRLRCDPALAKTPVVFCTGIYYDAAARDLAEACGVRHIIVKPCDAQTVLRTAQEALCGRPASAPSVEAEGFGQEHRRLLADKLAEQMGELQIVAGQLRRADQDLAREVGHRTRAEAEARDSAVLLRVLSRRLIGAQETERRAIARELHDEVGQALSTLRLNLHLLQNVGLLGMRERVLFCGGDLRVRSAPGRGTTVCARFPLPAARPSAGVE